MIKETYGGTFFGPKRLSRSECLFEIRNQGRLHDFRRASVWELPFTSSGGSSSKISSLGGGDILWRGCYFVECAVLREIWYVDVSPAEQWWNREPDRAPGDVVVTSHDTIYLDIYPFFASCPERSLALPLSRRHTYQTQQTFKKHVKHSRPGTFKPC